MIPEKKVFGGADEGRKGGDDNTVVEEARPVWLSVTMVAPGMTVPVAAVVRVRKYQQVVG